MEGVKRGIELAAIALMFAAVMLPEVAAVRYTVGSEMYGWNSQSNLTAWSQRIQFYNGDWLYFVFDRYQMNVLEVNETDFVSCNPDHPLHNWTRGSGRDVVPLNETRTYYFISGQGCFSGVKVKIDVKNPPPPPSSPPVKSGGSRLNLLSSTFRARVFVPALFAVAAVWDSFILPL